MTRKDLWLGLVCLAAALWALWPACVDARLLPANFGDLQAYHYPMRHLVAENLQQGRLPFWNPYIFSGLPLLANPQSALFYPLSALGAVLPMSLALSWDMLFHLCWAMLGVALLGRKGGLPAAAAWTAALLYGLSPFLLYRVVEGIPTLLASLAWAPWCWLAWASGRRGWLGAAWALQLLSGHPQFMVVNAAAMALWSPRRVPSLAVEGLWTLGLTALQWLPTWEFLGLSVRRSWPASYSLGYSLEWANLRSLAWPGALGDPASGTWAGPPSVFFETCALWVGTAGLALAGLGLARKRRKFGLVLMIAAGVLLALGSNGPLGTAGLSMMRTPSRWLLLPLWALVIGAGAGMARVGKRGAGVSLAIMAFVLLELCWWQSRFLGAKPAADFLKPSAEFAEAVGAQPRRVITDPELPNQNKTILYHARNANGYEAFYLDGYPQYAARSEKKAAADASRTYLATLDTPEMERLSVRWKIRKDGGLDTSHGAWPLASFVDAKNARIPWSPRVVWARGERWRVVGKWPPTAARLVISQPYYPGWTANLDGRPDEVRPWDGLFQSVERPGYAADDSLLALDLRFAPTGWPLWVAVTLLCWGYWVRLQEERA